MQFPPEPRTSSAVVAAAQNAARAWRRTGPQMRGFGRELGSEGIEAFVSTKHDHIDLAPQPADE